MTRIMTKVEEAVALLERYSNYDGMGIPSLAGCKEAMKVAVDALKKAFPELTESEDERIIEEIKFAVMQMPTERQDTKERCIAWLEKQKEQKPTPDWMPKFLDKLRSMKNYFDWDEHREIEGHILAIINWIAPNYFDRKEKEQKPISQEDFDEAKHEALWGEQKPAEWSEENKKAWDALYKHFSVIYPGDSQFRDTKLSNRQITDFLKALRPSWKPSEEQMNYLCAAVMEAKRKHDESVSGYPRYAGLKSLYEDLEKLCKR